MNPHKEKALELLERAKRLHAQAINPDAAGLGLREKLAQRADRMIAEAQVHATLALLEDR